MKLYYLTEKDYQKWDNFVNSSPQGSIFSTTYYLASFTTSYKILTVINKSEQIEAGIVLTKNEVNTYSSPMLVKYLGILFRDTTDKSPKIVSRQYKATELILTEIKKKKSFDYYFHPEYKNWIPLYWGNFTAQTRYTYRINYNNKSLEEIYKKFLGNLKNDIKNAQKNEIRIIQNVEFENFFYTINKTFLRQGSKAPFSKDKLRDFVELATRKGFYKSFGALDKDNNLISVCGIVFDNKSSYLLLNGIDIEKQIRGTNAFMLFETIKYFNGKCNYYDFEGSMLKGVEQFYRRFGAELTPYMRIWNDNFFNYFKTKAKKIYKKVRYGR